MGQGIECARDRAQGPDEPTLPEVVLRVEGEFRQRLAPLRVTPLQAGVILYLHRQRDAPVTDAAAGVGVEGPTLPVVALT